MQPLSWVPERRVSVSYTPGRGETYLCSGFEEALAIGDLEARPTSTGRMLYYFPTQEYGEKQERSLGMQAKVNGELDLDLDEEAFFQQHGWSFESSSKDCSSQG